MSESTTPATEVSDDERVQLERMFAESRTPFGPAFFLTQLAAFVRERCPDVGELPKVDLWIEGEPHVICHIIRIAPRWMALAVWNGEGQHATMSTEIVPYETISRVSVGTSSRLKGIGFQQLHPPALVEDALASPEKTLDRLMGANVEAGGPPSSTRSIDHVHATRSHQMGRET